MAEDNKINYLEWVKENIKYIFIGVSIGILIAISYKYYEYEVGNQSLKASELYYKLVLYTNDDDEVKNISDQIINNYSRSIYYPLTLFYLAKISHDKYDTRIILLVFITNVINVSHANIPFEQYFCFF